MNLSKHSLVLWSLLVPLTYGEGSPIGESACSIKARFIEGQEKVPEHLLSAISLVEAGRWDIEQGVVKAWPWTIHAQGKGYYFSTKKAAIAAARRLIAQGVRNIDVGCAQVNLGHHPYAFSDLETAFDPYTNLSYAAKFLKKLFFKLGSWDLAIAHYHSAYPHQHISYRHKVYQFWDKEKYRQRLTRKSSPSSSPLSSPSYYRPILLQSETFLESTPRKVMPIKSYRPKSDEILGAKPLQKVIRLRKTPPISLPKF